MKCFKCDASMATGATLFRVNEKGVKGIWACMQHRTKVDPEVDAIVSVIAGTAIAASPSSAGGAIMSGESIPSGALKVAEECKRLAEKLNVRYLDLCQRHTEETLHDFNVFRGALHAAIDRLAALASPSPATGALSDGPGTPKYRFSRLLDELEKRFPDPAPFSASLPEPRHLAMLDAALSSAKREPLTDAKVLKLATSLPDPTSRSGLQCLGWGIGFSEDSQHYKPNIVAHTTLVFARAIEAAHGIAATQVEPKDKQ